MNQDQMEMLVNIYNLNGNLRDIINLSYRIGKIDGNIEILEGYLHETK